MTGNLVLFDGVCNLCNIFVIFIIRNDHRDLFRFVPLQSQAAIELLGNDYPSGGEFETIIYHENGQNYTRSTAVLRIARHLRFPWPLMWAFIVIPPVIRNYIYGVISKSRYRWFGKRDQCMAPTPELRKKFIPK